MGTGRRRRVVLAVLAALSATAVACQTPPSGGDGTTTSTTTDVPTQPSIITFEVSGAVGKAPATVALAWSVLDVNGDSLTCRLDGDGDGEFDEVIEDCPTSGARNVAIDVAGPVTARLQVEDGNTDPVESTLPFEVAADPVETFQIELRGIDALPPDQAAAFTEARDRWQAILVRGIEDLAVPPRPPCLPDGSADLPAVVDDLIIDVEITPIDGAGGILGQAGPTCINLDNELPIHGGMSFDSDDVATLVAEDRFDQVVLHEMAHVIGFGTIWDLTSIGSSRKVINGAGTSNPRYTAGRGKAEYSTLGQLGNVPVENTGGPGTADAHWRKTVFGTEIMTGFLSSGSTPLSRLSIASMADLGFQVDLDQADPYSLPGSGALRAAPEATAELVVQRPPMGGI